MVENAVSLVELSAQDLSLDAPLLELRSFTLWGEYCKSQSENHFRKSDRLTQGNENKIINGQREKKLIYLPKKKNLKKKNAP